MSLHYVNTLRMRARIQLQAQLRDRCICICTWQLRATRATEKRDHARG